MRPSCCSIPAPASSPRPSRCRPCHGSPTTRRSGGRRCCPASGRPAEGRNDPQHAVLVEKRLDAPLLGNGDDLRRRGQEDREPAAGRAAHQVPQPRPPSPPPRPPPTPPPPTPPHHSAT